MDRTIAKKGCDSAKDCPIVLISEKPEKEKTHHTPSHIMAGAHAGGRGADDARNVESADRGPTVRSGPALIKVQHQPELDVLVSHSTHSKGTGGLMDVIVTRKRRSKNTIISKSTSVESQTALLAAGSGDEWFQSAERQGQW